MRPFRPAGGVRFLSGPPKTAQKIGQSVAKAGIIIPSKGAIGI